MSTPPLRSDCRVSAAALVATQHNCVTLQELALDDVLDAAADPDDWQPRTFVLKRGTVVLTLPEGAGTNPPSRPCQQLQHF